MTPPAARPVRGFGPVLRASERLQALLTPTDWPVALAERLGLGLGLRVRETRVTLDAPLGAAPALRVAFASDFHAGPYTADRVLRQAVGALRDARPDVLLLGGDYVAVRARYIDRLAPLLAEVPAPAGRFAVLGNHDYYAGAAHVANALARAGVAVLVNQPARLPAPFDAVTVCGLDDHLTGHPDARAALGDAPGVRLVLMHAPSGVLDLGDAPFALGLAGHTHGGQIALPGGRAVVVPGGRLSRRYVAGCYKIGGGRRLLVSRGVGQTAVPLRWNAPPEVHVVELVGGGPGGDGARG